MDYATLWRCSRSAEVSSRSASIHPFTCSGLPRQLSIHATATEEVEVPCRSAIGRNASRSARLRSSFGGLNPGVRPSPVVLRHLGYPGGDESICEQSGLHWAIADYARLVCVTPGDLIHCNIAMNRGKRRRERADIANGKTGLAKVIAADADHRDFLARAPEVAK